MCTLTTRTLATMIVYEQTEQEVNVVDNSIFLKWINKGTEWFWFLNFLLDKQTSSRFTNSQICIPIYFQCLNILHLPPSMCWTKKWNTIPLPVRQRRKFSLLLLLRICVTNMVEPLWLTDHRIEHWTSFADKNKSWRKKPKTLEQSLLWVYAACVVSVFMCSPKIPWKCIHSFTHAQFHQRCLCDYVLSVYRRIRDKRRQQIQ